MIQQMYLDLILKNTNQNKTKFIPSKSIIKESESLIIENNEILLQLIRKLVFLFKEEQNQKKSNRYFFKSKFFQDDKPYSVHRLDKDTSGVFIIAKNRETAKLFTSLFRLRRVHKTYIAICYGEIENKKELLSKIQ